MITTVTSSTVEPSSGLRLEGSLPENGASSVPVNKRTALRFSHPIRVDSANANSLVLSGPAGPEATKIVPAESGMLVFVTSNKPLRGGSIYTLSLSGIVYPNGSMLPPTSITFTTAAPALPEFTPLEGEDWTPGGGNRDWRTGRAQSPWQSLPALQAEPGVTAVAGQVLTLNGMPLANVTLQIEDKSVRTDKTGRFLLTSIEAGHRELLIDGRTASSRKKTYGIFEAGADVKTGQTNAYLSGELSGIANPLGKSATRFADSVGRTTSLVNPQGQRVRYEYDVLNRITRVTDPLQGVTQFSYDPNGNLLSAADARNNSVSYVYDNMDRVVTRLDPLLHETTYLYDASGSVRQVTDSKGQVTTYSYDALDRASLVTYQDGSTTSFSYDAASRLTNTVDSLSGTMNFVYDNLDRITSLTTPQGMVSYTYDAANRRTSMTVPGQEAINYTYDNANRMTGIMQGTASVVFGYDLASRLTSQTTPNGVVTEYSYDDASRLVGISYKKGGATWAT